MGMTAFYGGFDRELQEPKSLETISRALELGINFLDTAWMYQVSTALSNLTLDGIYVLTILHLVPSEWKAIY